MSVGILFLLAIAVFSLLKIRQDYQKSGKLSSTTSLLRSIVFIVQILLLCVSAWGSLWPLPIHVTTLTKVGIGIMLLGMMMGMFGVLSFDSLQKIIGLHTGELVISGIYRWSRNPQFLGYGLFVMGFPFVWWSPVVLLIAILIWIVDFFLIKVEEEHLEKVFGEEYRKYCSRTDRFFTLPGNR